MLAGAGADVDDGLVVADLDLYLASKSPRRRQLLADAGVRFALCEPGDEYVGAATEHDSELGEPRELAVARARRKALGAVPPDPRVPVLAVDTVVDLAGRELGKAADREAAAAMLRRLSGRKHEVHTAHCLFVGSEAFCELVTSAVRCDAVDDARLQAYLDSGQYRGKAGAYGIQDDAQDFLRLEHGAFDNVVGLHVDAVRRLLRLAAEREGA